jgi:hypothetical protein
MQFRTLIAASLAGLLALGAGALATSASAATVSSADQCTALEKQFDANVATTKASSAMVIKAKALRTDGGKLCASGKPTQGIKKLQSALKDIGLKPQS